MSDDIFPQQINTKYGMATRFDDANGNCLAVNADPAHNIYAGQPVYLINVDIPGCPRSSEPISLYSLLESMDEDGRFTKEFCASMMPTPAIVTRVPRVELSDRTAQ